MAEAEQTMKDSAAQIAATETQLAEREQVHTAQIADMETQLRESQAEIAASALKSTAENKEAFKRMEEEVAAKFEETRKTFEKSLLEAQDAARVAKEA